jgi:surface polysaccharide O-acyltransferase-like enzyme
MARVMTVGDLREAQRPWQRVAVGAAAALATYGFFGDPTRETLIVLGIIALLVPWPVLLPRSVARLAGALAGASLWIYLVHWQIYPDLEAAGLGWLGLLASLAAGVTAATAYAAVARELSSAYRAWSRRTGSSQSYSP